MKLVDLIDDDVNRIANFFLLMTSLQVLRYSRFVDFQRGIFSAVLLLNYSRHTLKIFSDGRRKIEIVHKGLK